MNIMRTIERVLASEERQGPSKSNGRLLLAEDHDINQILIKAMTERLGYKTEVAVDGADAVAKIDHSLTADDPFDLVLMDIQMPVMDGFQATRMIRTSGVRASILPIVAISAKADRQDIDLCLAAGMQAHIAKPVIIGSMKSVLDCWIKPKKSGFCASNFNSFKPNTKVNLLDGKLGQKYLIRKKEVALCVANLVREEDYSDARLQETADHLHKLAGTAAMFGDAELGIKAKDFENGLTVWKIDERPKKIKLAVADFLKAAQ